MITERKNAPNDDVNAADLLSLFIGMVDEDTGEGMTEAEISEEVLAVILGSHESTGVTLSWIFYELLMNPNCMKQLLAEVKELMPGGEVEFEKLGEMRYLKMVIYETLRKHPAFWLENRNVVESVNLGGVELKPGDMVAMSRHAVHHHPKYWEEPDTFKPERFDMEKQQLDALMRSGKFIPFGQGPRVCIGRHLAMMEISVIVVSILSKFSLTMSDTQCHNYLAKVTLELKKGLIISVEPATI